MIAALTLDDIDKTIYEAIRLQCVAYGLLPDILISSDYEADKTLIANEKGGYIEVFGQGSWFARGKKMTNRFVIDRHTITKGDIGGGFTLTEEYVTESGEKRVRVWKAPQQSKDILYEVRFVGLDNTFELVSHQILSKALSDNKYINCLSGRENTADLKFQVYLQNSYDISNLEFHERVWNFKVTNIFFYEGYEIIKDTVLIEEITYDIDNLNSNYHTEKITE